MGCPLTSSELRAELSLELKVEQSSELEAEQSSEWWKCDMGCGSNHWEIHDTTDMEQIHVSEFRSDTLTTAITAKLY